MIKSSTYTSISISADGVAAAATVGVDLENDAVGRRHTHMFYVHNQRNEQFSCTHTHSFVDGDDGIHCICMGRIE